MGKWDAYSRRVLRRRRAEWLRRNTSLIALTVLGTVVAAAALTWWVSVFMRGRFEGYVMGAAHATLVLGALHLLDAAFLASDREAIWHVRGAWGEENTRSELSRARRLRLVWGWVDSIGFASGDLDHLVVTRRSGLVVVDSKWRSEVTREDLAAMARSAHKAQQRAEALVRTVLAREKGTHRARTQSLRVTPVVVVWGAAQRSIPDGADFDGVRFLRGRELVPWLRTVEGDAIPRDAAKDVVERLKVYRAKARQDA